MKTKKMEILEREGNLLVQHIGPKAFYCSFYCSLHTVQFSTNNISTNNTNYYPLLISIHARDTKRRYAVHKIYKKFRHMLWDYVIKLERE